MVGVAVKVTLVPEQMVVADAATETAGVRLLLTVIVNGVDVAVVGDAHEEDDVITKVTTSPLFRAAFV